MVADEIEIWTDGGCHGNPGPGGWAFVLHAAGRVDQRSGFEPNTTNNRMELTAVREALKQTAAMSSSTVPPIRLHTDSQYVQKGITQWIHAWARNGWKTTAKKPVKNSELWLELLELSRAFPIQWVWVLGHAGNEMNERCDRLVQEAILNGLKRGA
jgi:ribonuclease HI